MNGFRTNPGFVQDTSDFVGSVLCTGKNQNGFQRTVFQQILQQVDLFHFLYKIDRLVNRIDSGRYRSHLYFLRFMEDRSGQTLDFRWHCCREEQRLALLGQQRRLRLSAVQN